MFDEIAEALLAAEADPDRADFNGVKPLVVASLAGHDRVARLIRDAISRRREDHTQQHLDRLGWFVGRVGVREDEAEFILAGTEKVDEPDLIIERSLATESLRIDAPFTSFDGWTRHTVADDLSPIALEAVAAGLPWLL
jgi:hypothetical protein